MKDFLLIILLATMASSKVTLQGIYAKKNVKTLLDGVFFNGMIFFFAGLLFFPRVFDSSPGTVVFGVIFGVLTVVFQMLYIGAMSCGNVSVTVMIVSLSMVIPIAVSILFYGDHVSAFKIAGFILMLSAFIVSIDKSERVAKRKTWFFLAIGACLANGGLATCQKVFGNTPYKAQTQSFVAWSYVVAFLLSLIVSILFHKKGEKVKINRLALFCALGAGVILGMCQWLNTYAISVISSVVLFPTYNGLSLILSTLSGVLLLKDRLSPRQTLSILLGVASIVLLNM